MKIKLQVFLIAAFLTVSSAVSANASILTFNSRTDFVNTLAAMGYVDQQTLNFDSLSPGTIIPDDASVGGVTFDYSIFGDQIQVLDEFGTTSSPNYIGLNNSEGAFIYGDGFRMTFDRTIHALGLYIVAEPETVFAGDFELSITGGSAFNSGTPDPAVSLSDGDAFFIGLIQTDFKLGFSSAALSGTLDPDLVNYVFNVDDITSAVNPVPVPAPLLLLGAGLVSLIGIRRKLGN